MTRRRERLDGTTNWAVVLTAAVLTWAFSQVTNLHYLLLGDAAVVVLFIGAAVVAYRPRTWHTRGELLAKDLR